MLELVQSRSRPPRAANRAILTLPPRPGVERFLVAAAAAGLSLELAAQLALERELVLMDAQALGVGREAARQAFARRATQAPMPSPLSATRADYVRALSVRRPLAPPRLGADLRVELPERLLTRAGGTIPLTAFVPQAVDEMIAWERAAALEGRTMGEWALRALAARRAGRAQLDAARPEPGSSSA